MTKKRVGLALVVIIGAAGLIAYQLLVAYTN
jgi:hypothetical protein